MKRLRLIYVFLTVLAAAMLYGSGLGWAQVGAGPCTSERIYGNQIKVFYDTTSNKCAVTQVCFKDALGNFTDCLTPPQAQQAVVCECIPPASNPSACDTTLTAAASTTAQIFCNAVRSTSPPEGCPILGSRYFLVGGDGYTRTP